MHSDIGNRLAELLLLGQMLQVQARETRRRAQLTRDRSRRVVAECRRTRARAATAGPDRPDR